MSTAMADRKLHLVGIGGAGMSGLAHAANALGASVSGSDRAESSYTQRLLAEGVAVTIGHDAKNLPQGVELVVSTAIAEDNPELLAAREQGLRVLHRSELLAELAELSELCITVAGTHGKTTTTAMIAHVLTELGEDPSWFVGGEVTIGATTANAQVGSGASVVIEADESDGSFTRYDPQIAVITNIEFEHPETWSSFDHLLAAFAEHASCAEHVVLDHDQPRRQELEIGARAKTFSTVNPEADYLASSLSEAEGGGGGISFELAGMQVTLGVRGEHNVENALAALAALELAGHPLASAAPKLAGFTGVARRFELIGQAASGASIYDDYAHHPTEVRAALTTARGVLGSEGRLVVFYQPHLFSRAITYRREFAQALALADEVVVLDIYPARERQEDFPGFTGWSVATAAADHAGGRTVHYAPTLADAETLAAKILREGDLCVTMGAGSITELSRKIVEAPQ